MKPLSCHRRATAKPNSFEFGTAVARLLEQALITKEAYWSAQLYSLAPFGLNKRQEFHSKKRINYNQRRGNSKIWRHPNLVVQRSQPRIFLALLALGNLGGPHVGIYYNAVV